MGLHHIFIFVHWLIILVGVIGNSLYLTAVERNAKLHTAVFILLANEALSDLLCVLLSIFHFFTAYFRQWIFGDYLCRIVGALMEMSFTISCFSLSAVAVERYKAICFATQYTRRTDKWYFKTCSIIWIVSFLVTSPRLYFTQLYRGEHFNNGTENVTSCDDNEHLETLGLTIHHSIQFLLVFSMPLILLIYTHSKIIITLKENSKTKFLIVSESTSQSKKIAFKEYMRKMRIGKLLAVTTIVFSILVTPHVVYKLIRPFNFVARTSEMLYGVTSLAILLSTTTNFYITLYMSKEFRNTVKDLLKIKRQRQSNTTRSAITLTTLSKQPDISTISKHVETD